MLGKIHSSLDKANLTENCVKLANIHTVTSDYLYYTLCYKKQIKEIDLLTVGAVQAKLPMYNIQSMKILVPPTKAIEAFQRKMNVLKAKYTDWSTRDDIKANLQVDLILLLDEFDYPPVTIDDVYKEVLEQAENFKKYAQ